MAEKTKNWRYKFKVIKRTVGERARFYLRWAVSSKEACNFVREELHSGFSFEDLENIHSVTFEAIRLSGIAPRPVSPSGPPANAGSSPPGEAVNLLG